MEMALNQKIRKLRLESGMTQKSLASKVNVSEQTICRYESGVITKIPLKNIELLANALHTDPSYLMGWDNLYTENPEAISYPVLGEVAAGYDFPAQEEWDGEFTEIPKRYIRGNEKDYFVLKVHGNSMYPLYMSGDKVLIHKQPSLSYSGQIGVVIYDGDFATLKRVEFVEGQNWMRLVPVNPAYPPKIVENEDLQRCIVLGVPKLLIRDIR